MARMAAGTWTDSAIGIYLAEIGRHPLLSAEEEIELAIQYERGRAARRQLAELSSPDTQGQRELEMAVERGEQARKRLIECNLRLVVSLTKCYQGYGLPLSDLVQEGSIGLMEAVDRYDHRRGIRFATYAGWWIRQAAGRAASKQARGIRLPLGMSEEVRRLRRARASLESRLERQPTLQELAQQMEASVHRIRQLTKWDQEILSLDMPVGDRENSALSDLIPDRETPLVEGIVALHLLQEDMQGVLVEHLGPREQEVLRLRFGLDDGKARTLEEVAQTLEVTRERVRQLEKQALQRLRCTDELQDIRAM
jgi:RNA polymerase primary sigma factor